MVPARGVRLDSGDLAEHARKARRMFDDGRLRAVSTFSPAAAC
jgi:nicotinic acid phosphoribosyltransferase